MTNVELRPAVAGDAGMLLAWRNDPWIVALSAGRRTVAPDEHAAWFQSALDRTRRLLYIVQAGGEPVGTVRFDHAGEHAVATIFLLRNFTGRGIGVAALTSACREAANRWPDVRTIVARIRRDNVVSQKAFAKAGFARTPAPNEDPEIVVMQRPNTTAAA